MQSERLGVVAFFGILVPGAYLGGILVLGMASSLEWLGLDGHARVSGLVTRNATISAGAFFFASYLLGVLVRLFAPRYVDAWSTWYLVHVRRKTDGWVTDVFPYEGTLTSRLDADGMGKVPQLMAHLNHAHGRPNNTSFLNYCKWFIDASSPTLSGQVQRAEALVRFLSGTALALAFAAPVAFLLCITFALRGPTAPAVSYAGLFAIALLGLCLILERFKYQRRREVIMVWSCVYLIVNGAAATAAAQDPQQLVRSLFFRSGAENADKACPGTP